MAKRKLSKDEVNYLLFTEVYQHMEDPKTGRKAFGLLEAAIQCFARKGFSNVTLEMVAREAGVTRPLIKHYFDDLNEIQTTSIKYIRLLFQKMVVDQMLKGSSPDQMLLLYVEACFAWVDNMGVHARVWLAFMHLSSVSAKSRELNTLAVQTGLGRIQTLLETGSNLKVFHLQDAAVTAKQVQTLITGALISYASEDYENTKAYCREIQQGIFLLCGCKTAV